jgi:hypothetical protein
MASDAGGPGGYWSDAKAPTAGQYRTIAILACEWAGIIPPHTALDATIAAARFRLALARDGGSIPTLSPADHAASTVAQRVASEQTGGRA